MGNKPDKFGIKCWMAADVQILGKGRYITSDNLINFNKLATALQAKKKQAELFNTKSYNVDALDHMAGAYTVKGGTCRWPVTVFNLILDLAGINSHIPYKECTSTKIARRKFMQQLAEKLRAEFMEGQLGSWPKIMFSSRSKQLCRHQNRGSSGFAEATIKYTSVISMTFIQLHVSCISRSYSMQRAISDVAVQNNW